MKRILMIAAGVVVSGLALGCTNNGQGDTNSPSKGSGSYGAAVTGAQTPNYTVEAAEAGKEAVAQIHGAGDTREKIHGTAKFIPVAGGVKVVVDVDGLAPGMHGIHIHEKADLSDPKLTSAGGHFNPGGTEHKHSGPDDMKRHAGDLGNIDVNDKGHGHLDLTTDALAIEGANGVVGHSIIIHEKEDDYKTQQPPGNAGGRVAGGAIVLATDGQKAEK